MSHVHPIAGQTPRRGATSRAPETPGVSGLFKPVGHQPASLDSPAVDACNLSDGFARARPVEAGDFATSSANAPASVVLAAPGPGRAHAIHGVDFGYNGTPTAGQLTITDGTTTYRVPVTSAGPGPLDFDPPMVFKANTAVSGSLSAGGSGVVANFGFTGRAVV